MGRDSVSIADVREMAPFVLRHRLIINNSDVTPDSALQQVLDSIPSPVPAPVEGAPVVTSAPVAAPALAPAPVHPHASPASGLGAESLILTDAPPLTDLGPAAS
jgi:hypothetical protein